jgi:hypothetical protein
MSSQWLIGSLLNKNYKMKVTADRDGHPLAPFIPGNDLKSNIQVL